MADSPFLFRFVGDSLGKLAEGYADAASSSLASAIAPIAISAVTMFVAVYGALIIAGKIQQPFQDFVVKSVKIIIITSICLNAGNYTTYVAKAVNGLESGLVSAMKAPGVPQGNGSIYKQLDDSLGKANALVAECFDKASEKNVLTETVDLLGYIISGILIALGIVAFFLVGGAIIVACKFLLAIMIALGPLFVLSLLSPATAGFFDRWLGQTLTYIFTIVLVAVVMSMGISIFDRLIQSIKIDDTAALFVALQILLTSLILAFVTLQVGSLASGISGGASMASLTLRQVAGLATSPARSATRAINPTSTRLDPSTGHQTTSSRLEHMARGRSVYVPNPAYRQAIVDRLRNAYTRGDRT